jgi:hypothetical protein
VAGDLSFAEVQRKLRASEEVDDWFDVLRAISVRLAFGEVTEEHRVRELVIRALDRRAEFNGYAAVLDSLTVAAGLYPYANSNALGVRDALEFEAHRPAGLDDFGIVFHRVQADVYRYLLQGDSVILSAPTSFGKSLIVDALLASGRYENVVIVVPTLALIDETRRRIGERFGHTYKVITHPQQAVVEQNVFVMTQERVLDVAEFPPIDIFVIDEFYKLDPDGADTERSLLLNQAFYRLRKRSRQFYMLGPSIESVPAPMNEFARVVVTDFNTVALDTVVVDRSDGDEQALVELCRRLEGEPTIVFCRSPKQAREVARMLVRAGIGTQDPTATVQDAIDWAATEFHPDWSFVTALGHRIGLHHGRLPRSLGQFAVRAFNEGSLDFLVCTSTLIEGVNTAAKNVVIYDNKIAQRKYDFFTFNNIRGRGGRMFSHFVGRVFLFHPQPDDVLRDVDVPVVTQPTGVDPSLLVQLDDDDLTDESREALLGVLDEQVLSKEEIRSNAGVDPASQLAVTRLMENLSDGQLHDLFSWSGFPTGPQLRAALDIIWDGLNGRRNRSSYVRSASQLSFRLRRLGDIGVRGMLVEALAEYDEPDDAVEDLLEFARNWAGFHFPRMLMVVDRIQRVVLTRRNISPGNYTYYASLVENLFLPRTTNALEEYGIPVQVSERLAEFVNLEDTLDNVLLALKGLDLEILDLKPFERTVAVGAIAAM